MRAHRLGTGPTRYTGPTRRAALAALTVVVVLTGCSRATPARTGSAVGNQLAPLDAAIRAISPARTKLIADISAVQAGASALDTADEVCGTGKGTAARTAHRTAEPAVTAAQGALKRLSADVTSYTVALGRLDAAAGTAPSAREALVQAVSAGRAEAAAADGFRTASAAAWPRYAQLDRDESTWITRALTPWYRSASEAANAYTVLVASTRPALELARTSVATASEQAVRASTATSTALAAADQALSGLRTAR